MADYGEIVKRVIAKYGPVLDLQQRPQDFIDILRSFRFEGENGGLPPGGTPPPPPPPGPDSFGGGGVRLEDVMAEVLKLARQIDQNSNDLQAIRSQLGQ
jgi:hypothetical protein